MISLKAFQLLKIGENLNVGAVESLQKTFIIIRDMMTSYLMENMMKYGITKSLSLF